MAEKVATNVVASQLTATPTARAIIKGSHPIRNTELINIQVKVVLH